MTELSVSRKLDVLVAHSYKWSEKVASEFREGVSALLKTLQDNMQADYPSLRLVPKCVLTGEQHGLRDVIGAPLALAVLEITDYDEDLALLAGLMQGSATPFVLARRGSPTGFIRGPLLHGAPFVAYDCTSDLFAPNGPL
jgi:hypothetical protein